MNGVMLRYDGIGIGSNKSFSVSSVSDKENFSKDADILNREAVYQNYGNPCDLYSVSLDGSVSALPENTKNVSVGLWSASQTDENGLFLTPVAVSMISDEYFSTAGITLNFDTNKGIFANNLLIEWYRDNSKISEKTFTPDNAEFFCANRVELFNRVDITFYSLNVPYNRLRLQGVEFGIVTDFSSRDLKNSSIKQSISPISEKLPINSLNFTIVSSGIDFVFQQKQPVQAYFNEKLKGLFFIKSATQKGENVYTVNCEDYIGILEDATFDGGVYDRYNTAYLIRAICGKAGVDVIIPSEIEGTYSITGYLPRGTCRKALQQVLFALQLYADTSDSKGLVIKKQKNLGQTIPRSRIMQGISIKDENKVTEIEMLAHAYIRTNEEQVLYDAKESGAGERIEVVFPEPFYNLILENGQIIEWSANHAVFDASERTKLTGKRYQHQTIKKRVKNPLVTAADRSNVLRIENATLVTSQNIDNVLNACYNYFVRNQSISAKIVEGKHESGNGYVYDVPVSLGDSLTLETAFKGAVTGLLESQAYSMNGGILVKECILR